MNSTRIRWPSGKEKLGLDTTRSPQIPLTLFSLVIITFLYVLSNWKSTAKSTAKPFKPSKFSSNYNPDKKNAQNTGHTPSAPMRTQLTSTTGLHALLSTLFTHLHTIMSKPKAYTPIPPKTRLPPQLLQARTKILIAWRVLNNHINTVPFPLLSGNLRLSPKAIFISPSALRAACTMLETLECIEDCEDEFSMDALGAWFCDTKLPLERAMWYIMECEGVEAPVRNYFEVEEGGWRVRWGKYAGAVRVKYGLDAEGGGEAGEVEPWGW